MAPNNLRAVVAQMYRRGTRQSARNLYSSPPGDSSLVQKKEKPSLLTWVVAGYAVSFFWSRMMVTKRQWMTEELMESNKSRRQEALKKHSL